VQRLERGPGRGIGRVGRGLTLSAACLLVPATAHAVAGGGVPTAGPFLFAAGLFCAACVALAGRQLSAAGIAALMFASQPVLHVLFSLSAHGHGIGLATPGIGMLAGHALAAGALTVLLAGGESVLWSMAWLSSVLLLRRVQASLLPIDSAGPVLPSPRSDDDGDRHLLSITRTAPRRGPPLVSSI
jgi:hypothetical protein